MSETHVRSLRPGKIIAVRRPYPSYFLKPAGSAAPAADIEHLTCEGEVALVIGTPARAVSREDAWAHVAWVTAANGLGTDGFTPIGPALIDARTLDPASLRVRTWVNGRLVQDDTTAGMLFGLDQIVADLSEHLTLEPGDVILTGTPAGSTALRPGDVVEVQVDGPAASSGRLKTTVVQGERPFDPDLGAVPDPPPRHGLTPELRKKLLSASVAALSAQLRKRGLNNVTVDGVRSLAPGQRFAGTARTLRYLPNREDLFAAHGGGYNAQKRAFDTVEPGEVLVIEARGETGCATLGDILALRAHTRGAAAIVTDGGVRDAQAVAAIGIAVFAAGTHPAVLGRKHLAWDADLTVACGGTTVQPGDVVVGDGDGVVVIPPELADAVADEALAQEQEDAWIAEQVRAGHPIRGLFPMNAQWRTTYEQRPALSAQDNQKQVQR